jgi:D-3-phosphoglycerate dehydrogenase
MKKILANDGLEKSGITLLESKGFNVITEKVAQENLSAYLNEHQIEVLLVRSATKVRKDLIDHCPNLKIIGRGGVGMDNIDVEYAQSKGIKVINTPAASSQSVAELVFSHLFTISRMLHESNRKMPSEGQTQFNELKKKFSKGFELSGKTIGIIGFGAIGQHIVKMLQGFSCSFHVFTRSGEVAMEFQSEVLAVQIKGFLDKANELDVIFVAIPLTKETHGMIDVHFFNALSEQSILVNISRGQVLNPEHLFHALLNKRIGVAAIDTWYNYPSPSNHTVFPSLEFPFHELDNIILSPHRAGYIDSGFPHLDDAIENLNRCAKGEPLKNIISLNNTY